MNCVLQIQSYHLPVPGDGHRTTRNGPRRHDSPRRTQNCARTVAEFAQESTQERRPKLEDLVLPGSQNEGHLPHDEPV